MPQPLRGIIAPSILNANHLCLDKEVDALARCGLDWLHLDIMDGDFVDNLSFSADIVAGLRKRSGFHLDVHLMVRRVNSHILRFAAAGADRLTIHVEADPDWQSAIESIRSLGCKAGIAVKPETPIDVIKPVLGDIDLVTIMGVEPGHGGQKLLPQTTDRVTSARRMVGESCYIQVDGGVKAENIAALKQAGADVFVAGSSIFSHEDYAEAVASLKENLA